eukprot:scaffold40305_cov66-Phaeocystis_antarctica.AAC.3
MVDVVLLLGECANTVAVLLATLLTADLERVAPILQVGASGEVAQQERLDSAEVHLARGDRREHRGQLGAVRGVKALDGCVDHLPVFGTVGLGGGGRARVHLVSGFDCALVVRDEHVSHDVRPEVGDASVGERRVQLHLDARDRVAVGQAGLKVHCQSIGELRRRVLADVAGPSAFRSVAKEPPPRNLCALVALGGAVDRRDCACRARADASDGAQSGIGVRRGEAGRRGVGRGHTREKLAAIGTAGEVKAVIVGSRVALVSGIAIVEEARLETPRVRVYVGVAGLAHAVIAAAYVRRRPFAPLVAGL